MMKHLTLIFLMSVMFSILAIGKNKTNNSLQYLNQTPPGLKPEAFAQGLILTNEYEFGSVFSKNADKFFLCREIG